jgi:hypothetical protein
MMAGCWKWLQVDPLSRLEASGQQLQVESIAFVGVLDSMPVLRLKTSEWMLEG